MLNGKQLLFQEPPSSRGKPSKHAAQATNTTPPQAAGPYHWGRAPCCTAVPAEHRHAEHSPLLLPSSPSSLSLSSDQVTHFHLSIFYFTALLYLARNSPSGRLHFCAL